MTTPSPGPSLTLSTDKETYNVGDKLTLTVAYSDVQSTPVQLTVTATATDSGGNKVTNTINVSVAETASGAMTIEAADSFGNAYTLVSNDGHGTAVLETTIGAPPA